METKLLWIIPGGGYNLEDGNPITYDLDLANKKDHPDYCKKFCEENRIDYSHCNSHKDFGKLLSSLGMIIVFNSALTIEDKYFCGIYLPEQMTENQIAFLENIRQLFKEKYHENTAFFGVKVYTSIPKSFPYKIDNQCRDLHIESIISNDKNENGQELLYKEIESQKVSLGKSI